MNDKSYMRLAIKKAKDGIQKGQTPFGACIVRIKDKKVISCAHNTVWKNTDITAHAEVTAIRAACKKLKTIDLSSCIIYSTCEPCPMCFSACHWAKLKKIIFGTKIQDAKKTGFSELSISNGEMKKLGRSPIKVTSDFLKEENLELFKSWNEQKNKKTY